MIVPNFFLHTDGGGPPAELVKPGDTVTVADPITGETVKRTIAAIYSDDYTFSGAMMSRPSLKEVLDVRAAATRFFVQTAPEADPAEVARAIQGDFVENGAEANSFRDLVEEFLGVNLQFFNLMQGYLALGLLVGIAGLGVVMVRSVRERRREIGVLRSLGFLSSAVRRTFLFESGFTALQGILIGAGLALITAAQLVATGEFGETAVFGIPWTSLGILCGAALLASLLATAWPAQQASQIPPAVALRVAE